MGRLVLALGLIAAATACGGTTRPVPVTASRLQAKPVTALHKGYIDFATGLYVREDDDLVLRAGTTVFPFRRTYRNRDSVSRSFGVGTSHPGEWYLFADSRQPTWIALLLANGSRIYFDRVTEGTALVGARFQHRKTGSPFQGATLELSGAAWVMRFEDGAEALFQLCGPAHAKICSLIEQRTADGHRLAYERDGSGQLQAIRSGDQAIELDYDEERRIVEARHTSGRRVSYRYDAEGRLARVTTSEGVIRNYTYSENHEMRSIREPGWFIENWYDDASRCIKQTTRDSDDDAPAMLEVAYSAVNEGVMHVDVSHYDGTLASYRFDEKQQFLSATYDANTDAPFTVAYQREPVTDATSRVTLTCDGARGTTTHTLPASLVPSDLDRPVLRLQCAGKFPIPNP